MTTASAWGSAIKRASPPSMHDDHGRAFTVGDEVRGADPGRELTADKAGQPALALGVEPVAWITAAATAVDRKGVAAHA